MANRVFYLLAIFLLALSVGKSVIRTEDKKMTTTSKLTFFCNLVENIRADAYNWEFTLSTQGWVNTGDRDWIWTGDALPDNETLVPGKKQTIY